MIQKIYFYIEASMESMNLEHQVKLNGLMAGEMNQGERETLLVGSISANFSSDWRPASVGIHFTGTLKDCNLMWQNNLLRTLHFIVCDNLLRNALVALFMLCRKIRMNETTVLPSP